MVESRNSNDNYNNLKISIRARIINPEKLKIVLDHFKTIKMYKKMQSRNFHLYCMFLINARPKK